MQRPSRSRQRRRGRTPASRLRRITWAHGDHGEELGHPDDVLVALGGPETPMVKRLQRRILERKPEAQLLRGPAEGLPFNDDSFDVAVSTLVLCTVDDQPLGLRELRRVLRRGTNAVHRACPLR